ncbi:response regulator transcription factor [Pseudomonas sp.]|jgi:DNA-binding NarL/FixJ family response regulator|uniref:response regulator transcription factor n=1 Tax=Pseudomonas sp. TaxID=306 RepID=UPI0028A931D4|nr:response regulator transcription factor [Pseudomonas sp.]
MERIIVADDHPIFREGLARIVRRVMPAVFIEEAATLDEVLALARQAPPEVLILDLMFPGLSVPASIRALRQEFNRSSIIIVSMVDDEAQIERVMAAGADGFVGKSLPPEEIGEALLAIRAGEFVVRYARGGILGQSPERARLQGLTPRQQDVLRLLTAGLSNKEIARELDISPFTVRLHVSSLLQALGVASRTAAAALGVSAGVQVARR